jgi:hypothetical protein
LREHFWKQVISDDADGRWVYELAITECDDRPGFDVLVMRHYLGFDGLDHEIEELSCEQFSTFSDTERSDIAKRQELTNAGFSESNLDD